MLFELLIENDGSVPTVFFHHSEEDMRYALAQPFVSIGSDGSAVSADGPVGPSHPHPRFYGTFPRVLGRYVRETGVLTLEEAVRKMTSANAAKIRQFDRGLLRPGLWADVTIFDPARVIDRATFEQPRQYADGHRVRHRQRRRSSSTAASTRMRGRGRFFADRARERPERQPADLRGSAGAAGHAVSQGLRQHRRAGRYIARCLPQPSMKAFLARSGLAIVA